jgi:hypothetical protein
MGYGLNFASPQDLHNLLIAELAGAGVSGGNQTSIGSNFPTNAYPTLAQIQTAENATMTLLSAALATARASGNNATVAAVNKTWVVFTDPIDNFFEAVRTWVMQSAIPLSH